MWTLHINDRDTNLAEAGIKSPHHSSVLLLHHGVALCDEHSVVCAEMLVGLLKFLQVPGNLVHGHAPLAVAEDGQVPVPKL